jgi:hypothetical protein
MLMTKQSESVMSLGLYFVRPFLLLEWEWKEFENHEGRGES